MVEIFKGIMKSGRWIFGLVGAAVLAVNSASAADSGFFVFGGAGVNLLQDLDIAVGAPVGDVSFEFEPGSRLTAGVGYAALENSAVSVAISAETGFLYNTIDRARVGGGVTAIEGDFLQAPFLAKVLVKFMPESRLAPFVGVGGGGLYSRLELEKVGGTTVNNSGDETDPAVQGEVGVRYSLSEEIGLGLSYKCLVAFPDEDVDELVNHSVSFVFSLAF